MFIRNRVKHQAFLKTLAFCFLAFLLSSCGGSKENLGPPSIPRELKYEFVDEGIKLTWKSPINNFNYKTKIGQDFSDPEYKKSIISENYFKFDEFVTTYTSQRQYIVYQEPDKENYEITIPIEEFLKYDKPDRPLSIYLRAYNEPPKEFREPEGGWNEELRDAGYGAFELQYYRSNSAVVYPKQPSVTSEPKFINGLLTSDSKGTHNDNWTSTHNEWMTFYEGKLQLCDFIDIGWNKRVDGIMVKTSGAITSLKVFTMKDYFYDSPPGKCIYNYPLNARAGSLKYEITLINKIGSTSLTGTYEILNPYSQKLRQQVPSKPTVPERWSNITPENERAAKTVWCIENGYRDYDIKTNRCIY